MTSCKTFSSSSMDNCHANDADHTSPVLPWSALPAAGGERIVALGRQVLLTEAQSIGALAAQLNDDFVRAVRLILHSHGRLIVSGMGKSGHIARKIAATMASTGTPAYFVHPAEASHGDLGMIAREDVLLALSNSGESEEVLRIITPVKRQGARLIAMSGNASSTLARQADVHLLAAVDQEACPFNLVPTASTTAALALGDALAVALLDARGFSADDFARSHPGGALGRRLLTRVQDVMRSDALPAVAPQTPTAEAVVAMSKGGLGLVLVIDEKQRPLGIFTDGDLRRCFEKGVDLRSGTIADIMHPSPHTIAPQKMAVAAVEMMQRLAINALAVCDEAGQLLGVLNMHDLFRAGVL